MVGKLIWSYLTSEGADATELTGSVTYIENGKKIQMVIQNKIKVMFSQVLFHFLGLPKIRSELIIYMLRMKR